MWLPVKTGYCHLERPFLFKAHLADKNADWKRLATETVIVSVDGNTSPQVLQMTLENNRILYMSDYIINLCPLFCSWNLAKRSKWHCLLIF